MNIVDNIKSENSENLPYRCKLCPAQFKEVEEIKNHVRTIHELKPDWGQEMANLRCKKCHVSYGTEFMLKKHMDRHHLPQNCDQCGLRFIGQEALWTHIIKAHDFPFKKRPKKSPKYNLDCIRCAKSKSEIIKRNCKIYHQPYKCQFCGMTIVGRRALMKHVERKHENVPPVTFIDNIDNMQLAKNDEDILKTETIFVQPDILPVIKSE